ncbi:MAG: ParB N-terminal domain-containing protein [Nitrosopumilaceae archaeon]|nr:ParB N-terminal domain-containing protein [Nitrosopumilaceae archaeon]
MKLQKGILSDEEYDSLRESIKTDGLWLPVIVNPDGVLLDGHNRLKICQELKIPVKSAVRDFADNLREKKFVIECNLKRRHLNDFQRAELAIPLL